MPTPQARLQELGRITRMERGTLCRMREGPHGPYFNHQTWENGRNVVRYVPREQVTELQEAIANYRRFLRLTQAYADAIIRQTRARPPNQPPNRLKRRRP